MKNKILLKMLTVVSVLSVLTIVVVPNITFANTKFVCGDTVIGSDSLSYGTVLGADGECWLDRNIGATRVATSSADTSSYGSLFQWGRLADGHQIITSGKISTTSDGDIPGNNKFITTSSAPYDWKVSPNNDLWQGTDGTNNVCPVGFRIPTQKELSKLISDEGITNTSTAYNSSLKLPAAGYRNYSDALIKLNGTYGYYWTSGHTSIYSSDVYFSPSSVSPVNSSFRSYGFSVRCIYENDLTTPKYLSSPNEQTLLPDNTVNSSLITPNGTIYIGGSFSNIGDQQRNRIAAFNPNGTLSQFNPEIDGTVYSMALSKDGSVLYIGGDFSFINGIPRNKLASFKTSDGTLTDFDPNLSTDNGGGGRVAQIIISPDGNTLYLSGGFTMIGLETRSHLAALDISDPLIPSLKDFNIGNINGGVPAMALSPNGSILYFGGDFNLINETVRNGLASINTNTGEITSFNPNVTDGGSDNNGIITGILVSPDNTKLYVTGWFDKVGNTARNNFASFNTTDGSLTDFGPSINDAAAESDHIMAISPDGSTLFIGGIFNLINNADTRNSLASFKISDETLTDFNPNMNNTVHTLSFSPDGSILYVGGDFTSIGENTGPQIMRVSNSTQQYFTSFSRIEIPQITTNSASTNTLNTASLFGSINEIGGVNPTTRGFEYGETTSYGNTTTESGSFDTGDFSSDISFLTCSTTYHYRAYAENEAGKGYGEDKNFVQCPTSNWVNVNSGTITTKEDFENGTIDSTLNSTTNEGDLFLNPNSQTNEPIEVNIGEINYYSRDGQLSYPTGIATDNQNNIYIADLQNCYIKKFDSSGNFISKFGEGNNNCNSQPYNITIDSNNNVYVIGKYDNYVKKYNTSGVLVKQFGSYGSGDGQFVYSFGIASDSLSNIYVIDTYNHRVEKFDSDGNYLSQFGSPGNTEGRFSNPYGITTDSEDNIYIIDSSNNRIQKFNSDGVFIATFGWGVMNGASEFQICTESCLPGISGDQNGQFNYNTGNIAIDSADNIYVTDTYYNRIQKFDSSLLFVSKWGTPGSGNSQFSQPLGITIDVEGNIHVVDTGNNRVQKFSINNETNEATLLNIYGAQIGSQAEINKSIDLNDQAFNWENTEPLMDPRMASASGVINGKIYIAGGNNSDQNGEVDNWTNGFNTLHVYNPSTNTWDDTKSPMSVNRTTPLSEVVNNKLYVIGGRNQTWDENGGLSSLEIYDPETDTWDTSKPSMSIGRIGPVGGVYDGKIYVIGGAQGSCSLFESSGEYFDTNTNTWTSIAPAPVAKIASSTAKFINGILYIAGGQGFSDCDTEFSNQLISYNPSTDTWNTNLAQMPTARIGGTSIVIDGKFYYIGGTSNDYEATKDIYVYDPLSNSWTTYTGALPTTLHRVSAQMVGEYLYLIGGRESILYDQGGSDWVTTNKTYKINKSNLNRTSIRKITKITWTATTPENTSAELLYSLDNGSSFTNLGTTPGAFDITTENTGAVIIKSNLLNDTESDNPSLDSILIDYSVSGAIASGTFTSSVINTGSIVDWTTLTKDETIPEGTSIIYQTRSGSVAIPDETWSEWQETTNNILSPNNKFIQIKVTLNTTNDETPVLHSVTINYKKIVSGGGSSGGGGGGSSSGGGSSGGESIKTIVKSTEIKTPEVIITPSFNFGTTLKLGSKNNEVKELQLILISKGYLAGTADGIFGKGTLAAVVKFQKDNGLISDGIVGPGTRALLNKSSAPSTITVVNPTAPTIIPTTQQLTKLLRYATKTNDVNEVKILQEILIKKGLLFPGTADGVFGKGTLAAVVKFQKDNNLTPDGIVGPGTRALLNK